MDDRTTARIALIGRVADGRYTLLDAEDAELVSGFSLAMTNGGYVVITSCRHGQVRDLPSCSLARLLLNAPAGLLVDHINGDRLDNRRSNLRLVTAKQNSWNRAMCSCNTSGHVGVTFHRRTRTWQARIRDGKVRRSLGYYKTKEEAAVAYQSAATKLHGEFFRPN